MCVLVCVCYCGCGLVLVCVQVPCVSCAHSFKCVAPDSNKVQNTHVSGYYCVL
eukprot:m.1650179 g.1650179  ORF g.1650179 m.1650179 type:complete len:53 (-) comp85585_c0_seq1:65-223(-)